MEFILLVGKALGVIAIIAAIETFPAYLGRKKAKGRKDGASHGISKSSEADKSCETIESIDMSRKSKTA